MDGRRVSLPLVVLAFGTAAAPAGAQLPKLPPIPVGGVSLTPTVSPPSTGSVTLPGFTPTLPGLSPFGTLVGKVTAAGPAILQLVAPAAPVVGQPATFSLTASGGKRPVGGVSFDFGESRGRFGEAACQRHGVSRDGTFSVPYVFRTPGSHTVTFEVSSGSCSQRARVTEGSVTVDVASGTRSTRQASPPDQAAQTADCPGADDSPTRATRTRDRNATLCLLNAVRAAAGLGTLHSDRRLRRIAAQHSRDMVTRRYFDHTAPPNVTLLKRLESVAFAGTGGENLGYGTLSLSTPRGMMQAWLNSTEHRANVLEGDYQEVGIAISLGTPTGGPGSGATYTTDFGGP